MPNNPKASKSARARVGRPVETREPEGGPFARRAAFLEERTVRLQPRPAADEAPPGPAPATRGGSAASLPAPESALAANYRRQSVGAYRQRQRALRQTAAVPAPPATRGAPPAGGREGGNDAAAEDALFGPATEEPGPPQPPVAPPANNWIPIGPSVVRKGQVDGWLSTSGRVNGLAVAAGGNRVYAAAANGGVWRSDDAGRTWRSLMDAWDLNPTAQSSDSLACGSIAIDPANADRVFVGTGDGNEAMMFGVGPVVSFDGGVNWATEPVAPGSPGLDGWAMNAIVVDPGAPDRVVAGAVHLGNLGVDDGGVYRREPRPGGGFHWARKAGPTGWITSVVAARAGGTTTFYASPAAGPVFSSTDGDTWAPVGAGFPTANIGRVGLAVRANDPTVVYALIAAADNSIRGVWRLDTGAGQWRQVTGHPADLFGTNAIGYQGTYDLAIAVDPNNVNRLYLGGSTKQSGGEWSGAVYRCAVSSSGSGASLSYSMTPTYIGGSCHADVHCLVFAPGDSSKLWVGCDGGVFYSTNPTGGGQVFVARNTGLQTLMLTRADHHPTEDAVVFAGTQDNGGLRFTGEEAWLHSVWGDCGGLVINWANPYRVLATYVRSQISRTNDGGTRYNYPDNVSVPLPAGDNALFYAPLAGTPPSATPAEAERVAFGSRRVWISETFGGGWSSIPNNAAGDDLGARVRSLRFASYNRLYAGTTNGRVFRFTRAGGVWTRTRLDTMGGASALGLAGPVTSIAIDPADATGDSIYLTFGGTGDYRHVWHFNGTQWAQRSGPAAGAATSLLDVQHNAVVCDPANPGTVFVGADIGVWRSTDGGATWAPFSNGLPDASVTDLDLHAPSRLLRAATYGRGMYEYALAAAALAGVELYVRDTQLDQGRRPTVNYLPDPTALGEVVRHWAGPDIKLDTPDTTGQYQFPLTPGATLDFEQFTNELTDDFRNVATHATATITTRVYVQVHNRGVTPAHNVRVMLLLANASAGLPALPFGFAANVQNGTPLTTADWKTVGFATLDDVRVGFPKIAAFDLPSSLLPPPASLAGNDHHCVLALVHHADDPFVATQTVTDLLSLGERKAAHKNLKVVQFTGTPPAPPPIALAVRLHNPSRRRRLLCTLAVWLNRYKGRVRLYLPRLQLDGVLADLAQGAKVGEDFADFQKWADEQIRFIAKNQKSRQPYNKDWCQQRIQDIHAALNAKLMLRLGAKDPIKLRNIVLPPDARHTVFLLFDRPKEGKVGTAFPVEIRQLEARSEAVIGGLSARVELVPDKPRR